MKTLYLDIFSGISGDMFIGALIDLGVDARRLERELKKLRLGGYHLHVARRQKSGIEGVKLDVHLADAHEHHHEHEPHHASRFTLTTVITTRTGSLPKSKNSSAGASCRRG